MGTLEKKSEAEANADSKNKKGDEKSKEKKSKDTPPTKVTLVYVKSKHFRTSSNYDHD